MSESVGVATTEATAAKGLVAQDVSVRYGGIVANDRVSIQVRPGQIVGLIGPNGAGKTSFVDALTGFATSTGAVHVSGRRVDALSPHRRQRAGLARTWQAGELFASLSVADNLAVAHERGRIGSWISGPVKRRAAAGRALRTLGLVGLEGSAARRPGELSLGMQRLVGVARALAGEPQVLLLDEPAAGLDRKESDLLGERLGKVRESGVATLLIDHDMRLVFGICDFIYVLDFGQIIAAGKPVEVRSAPAVVSAYLGAAASVEE